jgi:hypothetical protein
MLRPSPNNTTIASLLKPFSRPLRFRLQHDQAHLCMLHQAPPAASCAAAPPSIATTPAHHLSLSSWSPVSPCRQRVRPSSIADSSTRPCEPADSRLAPLRESRTEPQPAQIAADPRLFPFCPITVRLNVHKSCGSASSSPTCSFCPCWTFDSYPLVRPATVDRSSAPLHILVMALPIFQLACPSN